MANRHNPTGPSQDQLTSTPDDGRRSNWPKRCVNNNNHDEDNSPNNNDNSNAGTSSLTFRKIISDRYGPDTVSVWRKCEKLTIKLARETNHLTFLCRCRDKDIVPKGLQVKAPVNSKRAKLITERASRSMLRERIAFHRRNKQALQTSIAQLQSSLRSRITSEEDQARVLNAVERSRTAEHRRMKNTHMRKLDRLCKAKSNSPSTTNPIKAVVNLSQRQLTPDEENVLNKGLNFATSIRHINHLDIIAPIEEAASRIGQEKGDELRWKVRQALEKAKTPKPNLTRQQQAAMQSLSRDTDIIILPADKGNATVVMDKSDYSRKLDEHINDNTYVKLKRDPTAATERKLTKVLKKNKDQGHITETQYKRLNQHHSKAPHMYGLPKIHKPNVPLRPIVSCRGSACHPLSQFLVKVINPLAGKTESYVKNSTHFVTMIKDMPVTSDIQMVSFDVVSLFTNVPTTEALAIVRNKLEEDTTLQERTPLPIDNIMEMLTLCVTTTAFQLGTEHYQQKEGMAMGSPLSPVIANIYMEFIEDLALRTAQQTPTLWLRYVDDTFVLWNHGENITSFLTHLNSLRPSIQFTMEREKNSRLAFLDVEVHKTDIGFRTSVYRKPTDTGRYLNFESHHPENVKRGIVKCLQHRAKAISTDGNAKSEEIRRLKETFQRNGYPKKFLEKTTRRTSTQKQDQQQLAATICLPYTRGLSEKVRRICGKYNIRTVFRSNTTLRQKLTKVKPPTTKLQTKNCIYDIPCSCGRSYKGETCRPLSVRLDEHKKATIRGETMKSGMAEHAWSEGDHRPAWEEVTIIDREPHWKVRKIKEAAHIALANNPISKPSADISAVWLSLLGKNPKK